MSSKFARQRRSHNSPVVQHASGAAVQHSPINAAETRYHMHCAHFEDLYMLCAIGGWPDAVALAAGPDHAVLLSVGPDGWARLDSTIPWDHEHGADLASIDPVGMVP